MRVVHRVSINATPEIRRELASMQSFVGKGDPVASDLVTFEIEEAHESWPAVREWIARRKALDVVSTRFSREEIESARWLEPEIEWHHGYPQPRELDFGYREATYDLTEYCERCGIGLKQKAPFQMKGEPKWGKRNILQLNWIFDEYFVTPEVWKAVFKPNGIDCRSVVDRKGAELKTVVQLIAQEEVGILTEGLFTEEEACSRCGRTKYLPVTRGPFPALTSEPSSAMVKTREYFGSGASAQQGVLISQAVARSLMANNVRGASLRPAAEPS